MRCHRSARSGQYKVAGHYEGEAHVVAEQECDCPSINADFDVALDVNALGDMDIADNEVALAMVLETNGSTDIVETGNPFPEAKAMTLALTAMMTDARRES